MIVNAALLKCQELLGEITRESSGIKYVRGGSIDMGNAPSRCYAALVSYDEESPFKYDRANFKPIRNWVFGIDFISELADMQEGPVIEPQDKAFWHEGRFIIAVSADSKRCLIDFQVGPRYGRGDIYEVRLKNGECSLNLVGGTRIS